MKVQPTDSQTQAREVRSPTLQFRADLGTINEEDRTVEVIFSTGADVVRRDWWTGEQYIERLAMKPENVRLGSLNAGAPVVDTHRMYSTEDVRGSVVEGSARLASGKGYATLRFLRNDEDVDKLWNKITQKAVRSVSVAYKTYKIEEAKATSKSLAIRTAVDWEPCEISAVPFPADPGATMRKHDEETHQFNPCVIETRAMEATMENERSETIVEQDPLDPGAPAGGAAGTEQRAAEPTPGELGAAAETRRIQAIVMACRNSGLPQSVMDEMIANRTSIEAAQSRALEEVGKRGMEHRGPRQGPSGVPIVGEDNVRIHMREGIENALLHRAAPTRFELTDAGRNYRGLSFLDTAGVYLRANGCRTTNMSKSEIAACALGLDVRGGMHTTSDFPLLLANVFSKTLRREYEEAPATYKAIVRMATAPDFKTINRLQLGDAPALEKVLEHGEFKRGTISEASETYALDTWGKMFAITRKALINDDTDAFSRVPKLFGRAARTLESNLVWTQIVGNPVMGDGKTLFHADHNNLDSAGSAPSVAALSEARAAIRNQLSLDGQQINLTPKWFAVPTTLETEAEQLVMPIGPGAVADVNPFSGKLGVITDPRLDANSTAAWYVIASPDEIDIVELCLLEGQTGPMVESRTGWDIDGLEIKCRHDVAAKVLDYRGLYKNVGDT